MPEFKNPLTDPNITCDGKTLDQRAEELIRERKEQELKERLEKKKGKPKPEQQTSVINVSDYLLLKNISCVDADGKEFERYDELYVAKDFVSEEQIDDKGNKKMICVSFTPYQAASYFEKQDLFLPSYALSCNILAALLKTGVEKQGNSYQILDPKAQHLLDMHTQRLCGYANNTLVDWRSNQIIHYPSDSDFPNQDCTEEINKGKRIVLNFVDLYHFGSFELEEALQIPKFNKFIRNLTGLKNPEICIDIGDYLGLEPLIAVRRSDKERGTMTCNFGFGDTYFILSANEDISETDIARGVRVQ